VVFLDAGALLADEFDFRQSVVLHKIASVDFGPLGGILIDWLVLLQDSPGQGSFSEHLPLVLLGILCDKMSAYLIYWQD
jgi:hypothetical protein